MLQRVYFASSEVYPFSKSGGLGDVMGALPLAVARQGVPVSVITPMYGRLSTGDYHIKHSYENIPVGYPWPPITADVYETDYQGVTVYFIHRGEFFDRRYYYNEHKGDYFDNAERFIFFCRAAIALMERIGEPPSVVHAHDWQAALLPVYIHYLRQTSPFWEHTATMVTIHNLAFQGRFSSRLFASCGLPPEAWSMTGVEYYGDFNMLKGGIAYADAVSTVSESYAREILTDKFGEGLEGILRIRERNLYGILNGADYHVWDPPSDRFLPCQYSADTVEGKKICKMELIQDMGLDPELANRPLLGFIGRFYEQKGLDLLHFIVPDLMEMNVGVVVLGEGKLEYEEESMEYMQIFRGRYAAVVGYTEELAHRIQAGTDIFLMPSRYEPCGLTQMYALRYGTPPVATAVGGLRDTIVPWPSEGATGFVFDSSEPWDFLQAVRQAVDLWVRDPAGWRAMVQRAMKQAFTWEQASKKYVDVYHKISLRMQ